MKKISFSWDHSGNNVDGSAVNLVHYKLYEDGIEVVGDIVVPNFSLSMEGKPHGVYDYQVTAVDSSTGLESQPSQRVSIDFLPPESPTGLSAQFVD